LYADRRELGIRSESGVVLLLMALMLLVASASFALTRLPLPNGYYAANQGEALAQAKEYLLGYLIGHSASDYFLPFPDRSSDPQFYDGRADCVTANIAVAHRLGRYPWRGDVDPGGCKNRSLGIALYDRAQQPLWYAVAEAALEHNDCQNHECHWLTLLNSRGELISDRIVFLLIAPSKPLAGQDRSGTAPPLAAFLDTLQFSPSLSESNADFDEVFILAGEGGSFNDRLLWVTLDQLPLAVQTALDE